MSSVAAAPERKRGLARFDDRLNPVLVKEVRQALRGRYFRNLFWTTVVFATAVAVFMIVTDAIGGPSAGFGREFFAGTFSVLSFAVHAFVPFWAFQAMGAEWEENTYDLLVISNLRPRHLVLGKVLAATVQASLYYCAFAPFLVSTFLLGGVDLLAIGLLIGLSFLVSTTLSFVAVALSTLGRTKLVRAALSMVLASALLPATGLGIGFAGVVIDEASMLRDRDVQLTIAAFVSLLPLAALAAFGVACARLAHEEENRSTALRILTTLITLAALGWAAYGYEIAPFVGDEEWLAAITATGTGVTTIASIFFVTEPESFGRRVVLQVPASRTRALLALPWLPGGGRGLVLVGVHSALFVLGTTALAWTRGDLRILPFAITLQLYVWLVLGLSSSVAARFVRTLRGRTAVRIAIPFAVGVAIVGPAIVGLVLDDPDWTRFEHPLDPAWVLSIVFDETWGNARSGLALLALGLLATAVFAVPRLVRASREVAVASRAGRERESAQETAHAAPER
jgi:hypothetical protein